MADTKAISPLLYEKEYLELMRFHTRAEHKLCVRERVGHCGAGLDEVVRMYLALRATVPGPMRDQCTTDDEHEEVQLERMLLEDCCRVDGVAEPAAAEIRTARLAALCRISVVAHLLLYHDVGLAFIRWMCAEARVADRFPMFEFKLHALRLADSVQEVEAARSEISTLCTDRDMCELQLFCHDLLEHLERGGLLYVEGASAADAEAEAKPDAAAAGAAAAAAALVSMRVAGGGAAVAASPRPAHHIADDVSEAEIRRIVQRAYGAEPGMKALGYCTMLRTPFYDNTAKMQESCRVTSRFTPRDWFRVVVSYGKVVEAPGAPQRKRARVVRAR